MTQMVPETVTIQPAAAMSTRAALWAGTLGGILAAIGNLILFVIAQAIAGDQLQVPVGPGGSLVPLSPVNVALASFLPGVGAGLIYALLHLFSRNPFGVFAGIAFSFLLFSFTAPLGMPTIPAAARPLLAAMHVVAALAIVGTFVRARSS